LNGLYQVLGDMLKPFREKLIHLFCLNPDSMGHKCIRILITNILVCISWVFFRAASVSDAFRILSGMLTVQNPQILWDGSLYLLGLDHKNFKLLLLSIAILLFADFCKKRGIVVRDVIIRQDYWLRWLIIALSVCAILLFGIWGTAYDATNFIYFQF